MKDLGQEGSGEEPGLKGAVVENSGERCWKHFEREVQGKGKVEGHAGDVDSN
jgi:hypothetical protein